MRLALLIGTALMLTAACAEELDLAADPSRWVCNVDRPDATMSFTPTQDAPLAATIVSDGGQEDYPKIRIDFEQPQDWRRFMRLRSKLRVTCDHPGADAKQIAFVFYDRKTLRTDLEDRPMTQQVISHLVRLNRWVQLRDWLPNIHRSEIAQVDIYLYEDPPLEPHEYRWEFAEMILEGVGDEAGSFDTEVYSKDDMAALPSEGAQTVATGDGLSIAIDNAGQVSRVAVDGEALGALDGQVTGILLRDATGLEPPAPAGGTITAEDGKIRQVAEVASLGLSLDATYEAQADRIEVSGTLADLRGEDRAITLSLALPAVDAPWQWWDSIAAMRTAGEDQFELSCFEMGVAYGVNGVHSKYPIGAVSLPDQGGLTLGIRMDEPVVHRITYNPQRKLFFIAMDFGLVPETTVDGRSLSEVPFRILLYRHDPAWGFRSALQRYYDFFPEFFTKRTTREGGWYVWGDVADTEGALDAGFGFHWGPVGVEAVKWDNAHDLTSLLYIEPEFFQQTMGDFDKRPTKRAALDRLQKIVDGDEAELSAFEKLGYAHSYVPSYWIDKHSFRDALTTVARAASVSVNYDRGDVPAGGAGQYSWMTESKWGVIFPCNLDPDIPGGKGWFCRRVYIDPHLDGFEAAGAHFDGIALDSFGGYGQANRANYRREHFKYSSTPLSFSSMDFEPVQVAAFASVEWVRELAREMHDQGKVLMANCSWGNTPAWLTFGGIYLDIFGAEATQFADPDYIRAIAYRKACTDLPYKPRPDWEIAWHQLHGIYPGHGNKLDVMAQYAPILRDLSAAGWEPITHARTNADHVRIERYGSGDTVYLVVHNGADEPASATVTIDAAGLGMDQYSVKRHGDADALAVADGDLSLDLEARQTVLLELTGE